MLAFKPQKLDEIAPELRRFLGAQTVVVSLLAGVEVGEPSPPLPGAKAVARAIPNLPVAVRRGVTGLYSPDADGPAQSEINNLFSALGFAMWMADEAQARGARRARRRRPRLCRALRRCARQGGREARPHRRDRLDPRARDRARHRLDGRDEQGKHGLGRKARREPQGNYRGRTRGARPRSCARRARRADHRRRRAARRRLAEEAKAGQLEEGAPLS